MNSIDRTSVLGAGLLLALGCMPLPVAAQSDPSRADRHNGMGHPEWQHPRRSTCGCKRCVHGEKRPRIEKRPDDSRRQGGRIVRVTGLIDVSEGRTSAEMESRARILIPPGQP